MWLQLGGILRARIVLSASSCVVRSLLYQTRGSCVSSVANLNPSQGGLEDHCASNLQNRSGVMCLEPFGDDSLEFHLAERFTFLEYRPSDPLVLRRSTSAPQLSEVPPEGRVDLHLDLDDCSWSFCFRGSWKMLEERWNEMPQTSQFLLFVSTFQ